MSRTKSFVGFASAGAQLTVSRTRYCCGIDCHVVEKPWNLPFTIQPAATMVSFGVTLRFNVVASGLFVLITIGPALPKTSQRKACRAILGKFEMVTVILSLLLAPSPPSVVVRVIWFITLSSSKTLPNVTRVLSSLERVSATVALATGAPFTVNLTGTSCIGFSP